MLRAPSPGEGPLVSFVVIVYDMPRQAENTVRSLFTDYQVDANAADYEVVIVENESDNPMDSGFVRSLPGNFSYHLRKAGATILLAENGLQACQLVEESKADTQPDLVLMDMQMPELDGYQATQRLRSGGHRILPIIALTANATQRDREKCLNAGCDDFLSKPINPGLLIQTCADWIEQRQAA